MDSRGVPPPRRSHGARGIVVKPKDLKGTVSRLWSLTKGRRRGLGLVFLLSGLASLSAMLTPLLIGRAVDAVDAGKPAAGIVLLLLAVYLGDWAIRFLQRFLMAGVSQRMIRFFREALFHVMKALPLAYFDRTRHGELMSRLTNDIDNISAAISDSLTQFMMLAFTLTGIFTAMICLNVPLTAAALASTPLVFFLAKAVTGRTRKLYREQQEILGSLSGHIEETVSGLSLVKAYGREEAVIAEFERRNEALRAVGTRALVWSGLLMPAINVTNNLCFICVSVASGIMASKGLVSVGLISTFLLYSRQFVRPLNEVANLYNLFQSAVAGAERIFEIFDEAPEPADAADALPLSRPKGAVVFDNVWFGYAPDQPVLKGVSFSARPGERIAVVGPTGAGKTTIISLLARFYDVTAGRILLDGRDLREYRRKDLRACFGIVLQDTLLFAGTIRENIRYGREDAADGEVEAAAKAAEAHPFISRLPAGYDTLVEDGGGGFSQGERQLITIARAILADAPILILDEATSSVDTRTESRIRRAVLRMTQNRTSFIIAHRLSTIRDSDRILVIDGGKVAEMGAHEELMASGGWYRAMYRTQLGLEPD